MAWTWKDEAKNVRGTAESLDHAATALTACTSAFPVKSDETADGATTPLPNGLQRNPVLLKRRFERAQSRRHAAHLQLAALVAGL